MKYYDPRRESSYLMYWNVNNLHGWEKSQKLFLNRFEWKKDFLRFDEELIQDYAEEMTRERYSNSMFRIPKSCNSYPMLYNYYSKKSILVSVKVLYVICMTRKTIIHIRVLKQALDHGLILEKFHSVIEFNQEAWLKPYIDMKTELRTRSQKWFWEELLNTN